MTEEVGRSEGLLESLRISRRTFLAIRMTARAMPQRGDRGQHRDSRQPRPFLVDSLAKISMRVCTIARKVLARFRSDSSRPSERPTSSVMVRVSGG